MSDAGICGKCQARLQRVLALSVTSTSAPPKFLAIAAGNPAAEVSIVVNGNAVAAVLEAPDAILDKRTLGFPNTLDRMGCDALSPLVVLLQGAALSLALMPREGGFYVRA